MITSEDIKGNEAIHAYIKKADESLCALGYTEHSFAHVELVSRRAEYILKSLGYGSHDIELVKIAAYLHDIGNVVNRKEHSQSGAIMAFRILDKLEMDPCDIATIVTAIGNHDEGTGEAVNPVAAALIIADKSDVRRSRVRNRDIPSFDIHDRVNYSVLESSIKINEEKTRVTLSLTINTQISPVIDYFEIFLTRMLMCKKAAKALNLEFKLIVNGQELI